VSTLGAFLSCGAGLVVTGLHVSWFGERRPSNVGTLQFSRQG
jgi:hypothetical protein